MTEREQLYDALDLAKLLAPALGYERANQVVGATLGQLGFPAQALHLDEAMAVLRLISQSDGVVGVAGRFALTRVSVSTQGAVSGEPRSRTQLRPMTKSALIALFVPSVGNSKASEAVETTLTRLGITGPTLSADDVAAVLDKFVEGGGIIATVARFARARLLLRASEAPKRDSR